MKKVISIVITVILLSLSTNSIAAVKPPIDNNKPFGVYYRIGDCNQNNSGGYIAVEGYTEAYGTVDKISVELTLYRKTSSGILSKVWSKKATKEGTYFVNIKEVTDIPTESGEYVLKGYHVVENNGITETGTSKN